MTTDRGDKYRAILNHSTAPILTIDCFTHTKKADLEDIIGKIHSDSLAKLDKNANRSYDISFNAQTERTFLLLS
jgi:hypothetical protein